LSSFKQFDIPICVGISRKKLIGAIIGKPLNKRFIGGLSAGIFAAVHGANIIRTHDVMETKEALDVLNAIQGNHKE
jgi:dihydropteroate synthase